MTPVRVAILGGGAGALSAAFELTEHHDPNLEITVYTRGWRLGGKGASGRNAARSHRIEEHGMHLWFGFYTEAFGLMERVYAASGGRAPAATSADVFAPVTSLSLWDRDEGDSAWRRYALPLPAAAAQATTGGLGAVDYGRAVGAWLLAVWRTRSDDALRTTSSPYQPPPKPLLDLAGEGPDHQAIMPGPARAGAILKAARQEAVRLDMHPLIVDLLDLFGAVFAQAAAADVINDRWSWDPDALAAIDDRDFRAWITPALEDKRTLRAPFLRALYDLVFAYKDGDRQAAGIAAGVGVRGLMRIVAEHRGTVMYRLLGGMGDVVFAPLYWALKDRGVRFEFFCAVKQVLVANGRVQGIELVRQVRTGRGAYRPLKTLRGQSTWPSQPDWAQLDIPAECIGVTDFEAELNPLEQPSEMLERGRDFDHVVLGVPPQALGDEGATLAAADDEFRLMLDNYHTVATQALQLWLCQTPAQLNLAGASDEVTGGYAAPFDTYLDATPVLHLEGWASGSSVCQIAYFCGVLEESLAQGERPEAAVRANAEAFVASTSGPRLANALAGSDGEPGGTLDDQYWRANARGSARYVQSRPGSIAARLSPGDDRFSNLVLAGDWTLSTINAGSVEAAVSSGRAAAAALYERIAATQAPRASQWSPAAVTSRPPDRLFDFPDLNPGDRFEPDPDTAYIAAWWLPLSFPWLATAEVKAVSKNRLTWTEQASLLRVVAFHADVVLERSGPFAARLTIHPRLGPVAMPRLVKDYVIVAVDRNLIGLRSATNPADMISLGRMSGDVMQFHLRLPFGFAIHKSGTLS